MVSFPSSLVGFLRVSFLHALVFIQKTSFETFVHCGHPELNSLPMHINMHYTPSTTHHTVLHNPPLHTTNTKHICVSGGKMAQQDVGMVAKCWCRSHLVWLVFEGSIPTCTCFCSENFSWVYQYNFFRWTEPKSIGWQRSLGQFRSRSDFRWGNKQDTKVLGVFSTLITEPMVHQIALHTWWHH